MINKITFTGADDNTPIDELFNLSSRLIEKGITVEWGILFSISNSGKPRYPSSTWIKEILTFKESLSEEASKLFQLSAHLCGAFTKDIFIVGSTNVLSETLSIFDRAQLNYNFRINEWSEHSIDKLIEVMKDHPTKSIILQQNKSNAAFIELAHSKGLRFDLLYDASGGRGKEIQTFQINTIDCYTGYSGGINDKNVIDIIKGIERDIFAENDKKVWIDMESGIRDEEDGFSLEKITNIINAVEEHYN